MSKETRLFLGILTGAIIWSLLIAYFGGRFQYSSLDEDVGMIAFHETAHNLITFGAFGTDDNLFAGFFRRPPAYSLLLAVTYLIFGEKLWAVWGLHLVLWALALFVLWRVSRRFLDGIYALLPPVLLGFWWGASANVFIMNAEVFAIVVILLFVYFSLRYTEEHNFLFVVFEGMALAVLILIKPIFLYFIPIVILFYWLCGEFSLSRLVIFLVPPAILVGSWALYSQRTFGTYDLASGALTLMRRADDVNMSGERIYSFIVATLLGDFNADRIFPGYADNPEPVTKESVERERTYTFGWKKGKANEAELQQKTFDEAKNLIFSRPLKYLSLTPIYAIRLHMPVNYRGEGMDHTFAGPGRENSKNMKTFVLAAIFLAWYLFIGIIFWSYIKRIKEYKKWGVILLVFPYLVIVYALVSHAETRYILPVMPFYFLLFAVWSSSFIKRIKR